MKINRLINIFILASLLAFGLSSCRHTENEGTPHHIIYAVQNANTYAGPMSNPETLTFVDDDAWNQQLESFLDYVQAGNTVTFYNADNALFMQNGPAMKQKSASGSSPKSSTSIKTRDRNEMKEWCRRMEQEGRTVVMDYDRNTGTWSGYAYALPPAMASQVKTYACNLSGIAPDFVVLLTADTVKNRIYSSSNLFMPDYFNLGVVSYNHFNPADSGIAAQNGYTYLYMSSLLNGQPINGFHYAVPTANFNFQSNTFSINNLDLAGGGMPVSSLDFSTTTDYETWVCEENGYNIVLHIDRSTIDPSSYSFSGYMVLQMNNPSIPTICGEVFIVSQGAGSGTGCDENISLNYGNGGGDAECGVELVSDELVVWHFGSESWVFCRLM